MPTVEISWFALFRSIPLKGCYLTRLEVALTEGSGFGIGGGAERQTCLNLGSRPDLLPLPRSETLLPGSETLHVLGTASTC